MVAIESFESSVSNGEFSGQQVLAILALAVLRTGH
jgi:hypothetical protein